MARILYADDSATARSMAKSILADAGHEVLTVNSAEEARTELPEFAPELVMLDVFMGGVASGLELASDIRESAATRGAALVLAIGKMETADPSEIEAARADAIVTKPLESEELTRCISDVLEKASGRQKPDYRGLRSRAARSAVQQLWPAAAVATIYGQRVESAKQDQRESANALAEDPVITAVARVLQRLMPQIVEEVKRELGK